MPQWEGEAFDLALLPGGETQGDVGPEVSSLYLENPNCNKRTIAIQLCQLSQTLRNFAPIPHPKTMVSDILKMAIQKTCRETP